MSCAARRYARYASPADPPPGTSTLSEDYWRSRDWPDQPINESTNQLVNQLITIYLQFLLLLAGNTTPLSRRLIQILLLILLFSASRPAAAQQWYKIKGTVYDSSRNYPVEFVSVLSTSGKGTVTNTEGHYEIEVTERDSIWFSYLNKPTIKFPVLKIV